ncbi:amino acid adenylation domain-containing protein [Amycolatopsis marina]|uniref:Amino acid adenylation domain-containing protein n=1 Tax=Amycolatopsis marina TaxID=490629 RepID=A0A1I1B1A8_9PSEU|nr:non-ribosomal peptide synthetase [Amycolatopsis marina]SFB44051.1 amino acid adenylation domain-containing protein [Amycolatopsis marina]
MTNTMPVAATQWLAGQELSFPDTSIAELILAQAARTPDAVAVRQWDVQLSYRELVAHARSVADVLRERGVRQETRVGVCAERSPALVSTVLGVLLSGGCYVPLEPGGPASRLAAIAADAGVTLVVGDAAVAEFGAAPGIADLETPPLRAAASEDRAGVPVCPAVPANTAHVLYTSGSTGTPKGVLTSHRNIVAFVTGWADLLGIGPGTRTLGIASPAFDAFTMDVFAPLAHGGSVQLLGTADRADPERLRRFLVEHQVNSGFITPTVLALLDPADVPDWQIIACGGEKVPAELAAKWLPGRRFLNVYGPTETTVVVLTHEVSGIPADPVPIGTPTPNHRAYVVDDRLRLVGRGETGELLIGGPGVAGGYLGRPELTASRFVEDPFADRANQRLYRTGDLVRVGFDGRIEFVGRADRQVKVRGQRIELGEVEAALSEHPGVTAAAVEAVNDHDGTRLVAFVTPATAPSDVDIRAHTEDRLTPAMRPAAVVRLNTLPLNPVTGKVDRPALRSMSEHALASQSGDDPHPEPDASANPVRHAVTRIWGRVLGPMAGNDFLLSGGDSISAMRLVAALRAELTADVGVEDVLAGRTLRALAQRVADAPPLAGPELATGNPPALSPPQRRLWFLDQLAPDAAPYNIAMAFRLSGQLDQAALRAALRAVTDRHDVLRWRIRSVDGVPQAECRPVEDVPLPVLPIAGEQVRARLATDAATPLRLDEGPPWRARLYRLGDTEHVLGLTLHHAVFDGWSQALLCADLAAAYSGATLEPTVASYADYAVWRADRDERRAGLDVAWWTEHLRDVPTTLDLPRDRARPAVQTYRGATLYHPFPDGSGQAIRELAATTGSTTAGVLLAGFGQLLHRLTGTTEQLVATVVADRQLAAFQDVAGFFVDIVPVRLCSGDAASFSTHVRRCDAELRAATAHPAASIERLVTALGVGRDTSRAPLVQVMLNVLNFSEPSLLLRDVRAEWLPVDKPGSPFDLTVYVLEHGVELLYNPDLFDRSRMAALAEDFLKLVAELTAAPHVPIAASELPRPALRSSGPAALIPGRQGPVPAGIVDAGTSDPSALAATESMIAAVWREVLGLESVRVTDNFFDVGGHSLALAEVHAKVTARLGRPIPMVELFTHPNIRALAVHLHGATRSPELARAAERVAARRGRSQARRPRRTAGTTGTAEQE